MGDNAPNETNLYYCAYSHGQKIVERFTKLSKLSFSKECFTDGFSLISSKTAKICFWVAGWGITVKVFVKNSDLLKSSLI